MVRGLRINEGTLFEKVRKYGYLLLPLIFTSLKRVQLMANALDAKGFAIRNRAHRFYRMPAWKRSEIAILVIGFCLVAVLIYLARIHPEQVGVVLPYRI